MPRWHILACCICIVGLSLTVLSDALLKKEALPRERERERRERERERREREREIER